MLAAYPSVAAKTSNTTKGGFTFFICYKLLFKFNEVSLVLRDNLRVTNIDIIISSHDIKGMIRNIKVRLVPGALNAL